MTGPAAPAPAGAAPSLPPVALSARRPVILGLVVLLALVGGFGGWSVLTTIAGAIVAPGRVAVANDRQVVQHADGGTVAEIAVHEGDRVAAGALLLRLDGAALLSERAIIAAQLSAATARRARLQAERDGAAAMTVPADLRAAAAGSADAAAALSDQIRLFETRADSLAQQTGQIGKRIDQIGAQVEGIAAQRTALDRQLALVREEARDQQTLLGKGLTQAARLLALQREEARIEGELGRLLAARAEAEGKATELAIERDGLVSSRREQAIAELREVAAAEAELAERGRALDQRIQRLEIRAPVSGVVLGMQVTTPRAVITPAEPVLYLVPQDRPLVIEAEIPPQHIDELRPGQPVRISFPGFSARTTPQLTGRVRLVSADVFQDQRRMTSYYRAEIELPGAELARLGGLALVPGMPAEAFIQTGARSPLAWLVRPLADYFTRAFREG